MDMETIGVKDFRNKLSHVLKSVEEGTVIRVLRHGKEIVELRPISHSTEQEVVHRLRKKEALGGGQGRIGRVKSVRNATPEKTVSGLVIEERR